MELIKEPIDIDISTKSEPWTEKELADFREIMQQIKSENARRKKRVLPLKNTDTQTA